VQNTDGHDWIGDDEYGYEDSGERWLPVHTVTTILLVQTRMTRMTGLSVEMCLNEF
jgi:hypothetical protein